MERRERRAYALVACASDAEIRELQRTCRRLSFDLLHVRGSVAGAEARVLFVGRGMAGEAQRREAEGAFDLLIAHDESVLTRDALLQRCSNVLVAPYDEAALAECLDATGRGEVDLPPEVRRNIIGRSPRLREMLHVMVTVARYDAPVLIRGETGTGKELVARGIHYSSKRRDHPFVPVNCGALNDELLLAELFGYEKGAFTDAKRSHRGFVAQAAGGVLFLDEIDSLTPKGQAALLRFLQEQEYRPLGSESVLHGDVRVITATNKNLETAVAQGRFREDLYYRIHLLDVALPPLRQRDGDVVLLAEHFLAELARRYGVAPKRLHPLTLRWMTEYAWPGNVRELQNYMYRLFVLSKGSVICAPRVKGDPVPMHVGAEDARAAEAPRPFHEEKAWVLQEFERTYLDRVMRVCGGNVSLAARRAGKERRAFRRLLKKHGIDREAYKASG